MDYSWKFHKATGMPTSLDSIFFGGPYLLCYCVRSWPHLSVPITNSRELLCPTNSLLVSRYHFRIWRDFRSKNPLSGFAPKQTKESSAWRATHIVLHSSSYIPSPLFYHLTSHSSVSFFCLPSFLLLLLLLIRNLSWWTNRTNKSYRIFL